MTRNYLESPIATVRRKDRAVEDDAWIVALLHRAPMAQLATVHDGQPFINSNLFAYDETSHAVYMHTAAVGRTRANVDAEMRVCLSVSEMGRLLPSHEALTMSVEYGGVAIFGRARALAEEAERESACASSSTSTSRTSNTASTIGRSLRMNPPARPSIASRSTSGAASASRLMMTSPAPSSMAPRQRSEKTQPWNPNHTHQRKNG